MEFERRKPPDPTTQSDLEAGVTITALPTSAAPPFRFRVEGPERVLGLGEVISDILDGVFFRQE